MFAIKLSCSFFLFNLASGRRGVFDGVIEGIRQHWKHREIVKVITMQKKFSQVLYTAKLLEAESCGILVSVEKIKEGHAIIMYRGKNYKRPKLLPRNLLNKRDALSRSLEIQRNGVSKLILSLLIKLFLFRLTRMSLTLLTFCFPCNSH